MQFFINEVSLKGQYINQESFSQAIQIFITILDNIKKLKNYSIYKDSQTFINYQAIEDQNFQQSLNKISDKSIATAFKNILYNKINPQDWRNQRIHKENDYFDYKDRHGNNIDVRDTSLAEVAERTIQIKEQIYLVINFSNSVFQDPHPQLSDCYQIIIIKNNDESDLIYLNSIDSKSGLENWKNTLPLDHVAYDDNSLHPPRDEQTILSDTSKFVKVNRNYSSRRIYQEKQTGYYYYVDNKHFGQAAHLEVFDAQGNHLGEADLEGKLDTGKKDPNKSLKI